MKTHASCFHVKILRDLLVASSILLFLIVGSLYRIGPAIADFFAIEYGTPSAGREVAGVAQAANGNYWAAGRAAQGPFGSNDIFVLKFDPNGTILSQRYYGNSDNNLTTTVNPIAATADGGAVVIGLSRVASQGGRLFTFVLKIDAAGAIQWLRWLGGATGGTLGRTIVTTPTGYLVSGGTGSFSSSGGAGFLAKLDQSGAVEWFKIYDIAGKGDNLSSVLELPTGNLFAGGSTGFGSDSFTSFWVIQTDSAGNLLNQRVVETDQNNIPANNITPNDVFLFPDGHLGIGGDGNSAQEFNILKINRDTFTTAGYHSYGGVGTQRMSGAAGTPQGVVLIGNGNGTCFGHPPESCSAAIPGAPTTYNIPWIFSIDNAMNISSVGKGILTPDFGTFQDVAAGSPTVAVGRFFPAGGDSLRGLIVRLDELLTKPEATCSLNGNPWNIDVASGTDSIKIQLDQITPGTSTDVTASLATVVDSFSTQVASEPSGLLSGNASCRVAESSGNVAVGSNINKALGNGVTLSADSTTAGNIAFVEETDPNQCVKVVDNNTSNAIRCLRANCTNVTAEALTNTRLVWRIYQSDLEAAGFFDEQLNNPSDFFDRIANGSCDLACINTNLGIEKNGARCGSGSFISFTLGSDAGGRFLDLSSDPNCEPCSLFIIFAPPLEAALLKVEPEAINTRAKGVFTIFMEIPEPFQASDLNLATFRANGLEAVDVRIAADGRLLIAKVNRSSFDYRGGEIRAAVNFLIGSRILLGTDSVRLLP